MTGVDLAALRATYERLIAVQAEHDLPPTQEMVAVLALVEAVEAAQAFVDVWTGSSVGQDTFGHALTRTRAALAPFRQEQP